MLRKRFGYVSESTKKHLKAIEVSHTVFTINVFSKVQDLIIMIIENQYCYTEFFQLAEPGNSDQFLVLWIVDRGMMLLTIYMKKKNQNLSPKNSTIYHQLLIKNIIVSIKNIGTFIEWEKRHSEDLKRHSNLPLVVKQIVRLWNIRL